MHFIVRMITYCDSIQCKIGLSYSMYKNLSFKLSSKMTNFLCLFCTRDSHTYHRQEASNFHQVYYLAYMYLATIKVSNCKIHPGVSKDNEQHKLIFLIVLGSWPQTNILPYYQDVIVLAIHSKACTTVYKFDAKASFHA